MRTKSLIRTAFVVILSAAGTSQATLLTQVNVSVSNSGGAGGLGADTTDMVYAQYNAVDGWGWAGGAGSVQGTGAINNAGGFTAAANEALKFKVGATVDSLNATYGAGNWTIENPKLAFASSYSIQNNSRFGRGSGTFEIYWVGQDTWAQSHGVAPSAGFEGERELNPVYASTPATLLAWSGGQSLLNSTSFTVPGGATGFVNLSYPLAETPSFVNDIVSSSASGGNPAASLYLMGTSDTLGMIIFTGGQAQPLPTLSFDVVTVPEPAAIGSLAFAALLLARRRTSAHL